MTILHKIRSNIFGADEFQVWNVPRAGVRRTGAFNPANGLTAITFDTLDYDTDGMFTVAVAPTLFTIRTAGLYLVTASMGWVINAASYRQLYLSRNGSAAAPDIFGLQLIDGNAAAGTYLSTAWPIRFNAGDTVAPVIGQATGGALVADPAWIGFTASFISSI